MENFPVITTESSTQDVETAVTQLPWLPGIHMAAFLGIHSGKTSVRVANIMDTWDNGDKAKVVQAYNYAVAMRLKNIKTAYEVANFIAQAVLAGKDIKSADDAISFLETELNQFKP